MIVLKSTFDKTAKLAKAACISRDLWRNTAKSLEAERDALQAKVDRMTGGLRQNRKPKFVTDAGGNIVA